MSTQTGTTLKTYFNTGDQPTEAQFGDLIDSNLNLTDGGTLTGKLTSDVRAETWGTSVAAAGGDQAGATEIAIDGGIIAVTAADNSKGVKLPAVSGLTIGDRVKIWNSVTNKTLEVYPGSGDRIFPVADDGPVTIAACGWLELVVYSADGWAGNEGVIGA
tara:strand:- start:314 stop:793 length:480 start_codon:yes stop_codon:yes gene_type:complete